MFIESVNNKIIKQIISLGDKKTRDESGLFIVEGKKQVSEIPNDWPVECYVAVHDNLMPGSSKKYLVSPDMLRKISDTDTPQGVLAVVHKKHYDMEQVLTTGRGIFLLLDTIQDPGNLGTIIRTAHAYGVKGIFISKNSVDVFSPKVVRATMGSVFKVPLFQECSIEQVMAEFIKKSIKTYALAINANMYVSDAKFADKTALIVGNESKGIADAILNSADYCVKIKMVSDIDSLNAAVACSIALYEASGQISF